VRKTLDDNFGRKDGGADVEVEGVNVQHAYERGWGDINENVAKISVRGIWPKVSLDIFECGG